MGEAGSSFASLTLLESSSLFQSPLGELVRLFDSLSMPNESKPGLTSLSISLYRCRAEEEREAAARECDEERQRGDAVEARVGEAEREASEWRKRALAAEEEVALVEKRAQALESARTRAEERMRAFEVRKRAPYHPHVSPASPQRGADACVRGLWSCGRLRLLLLDLLRRPNTAASKSHMIRQIALRKGSMRSKRAVLTCVVAAAGGAAREPRARARLRRRAPGRAQQAAPVTDCY